FAPLVYTLSVIAIVYTSLVALMQEDIKKLIAYSSVAHMGFVTLAIFAGPKQGVAPVYMSSSRMKLEQSAGVSNVSPHSSPKQV
ncbi:hypothetical protein KC218_26220, partial [Mycobacterium tuberculosis]|nr:hypothetical protein [Mycobacterium tuberculosis]